MTDPAARDVLRWPTVAAIYLALTLAYCWPLILSLGSGLPNDTGDPGLLSFVLWWNARTVPFTDTWWNAPMFYPARGALAFSDTLLGMSPFTSPLIWAGAGAVAAHNSLFVASVLSAALAAHALAKHLTGRHDVALIAGLAFGFNPYRASQMPHLQLLVTCWMALGLWALHRYLDRRRMGYLVVFGSSWCLNAATSGYYLVFYAVLVGLWMLWFLRDRRSWIGVSVSALVGFLPLVPMLIGHHEIQRLYGMTRSRGEIESYSADVTAFLAASSHAWLPFQWTLEPRPEGELYPGLAIVLLTLAGAVVTWRRHPVPSGVGMSRFLASAGLVAFGLAAWSGWSGGLRFDLGVAVISMTRTERVIVLGYALVVAAIACDRRWRHAWASRSAFAFYGVAALLMAFFALGPVGRINGVPFINHAPYAWLMELPGGDSLRVPARFAMLMVLCLSVSAALALARLSPRRLSGGMLSVLAILVAADGWVPKLQVASTSPLIALPGLEPRTAVVELPMRDLWTDTAAMVRSTRHGLPTVNGFSGYGPPHYAVIQRGLGDGDASVIESWRTFGPLAVIVNAHDDPEGTHEAFIRESPDARLTYRLPLGSVYRFPAKPTVTLDAAARPLPIASVAVTANSDVAWALVDGRLDTQWKTPAPQKPGDAVMITLEREHTVARVELAMADTIMDYPRTLRIDATRADGTVATVWQAGTAGPAAIALISDRARMPLAIDLPPGTTARELTLTLEAADDTYHWTVAELRVFGW
jgi:hypothetical protein